MLNRGGVGLGNEGVKKGAHSYLIKRRDRVMLGFFCYIKRVGIFHLWDLAF